MFKKKRTNLYDSYEDDIQDIASKETELLKSYNENTGDYYDDSSDNENLDIDNIDDYEVIEIDDSDKEEKELEVDNDSNRGNNMPDYEQENYDEYSTEDGYLEENDTKQKSSKLVRFLNILFVIIIISL